VTAHLDLVAAIAERLAVLLTAGLSPAAAWGYLLPVDGGSAEPRAASVTGHDKDDAVAQRMLGAAAEAGRRGSSVADALRAQATLTCGQTKRGSRTARGGPSSEELQAWLSLAAAWQVATESGAPLASCLRRLAEAFRDVAQLHRDTSVALAGPRATARMVLFLPLIGLVFGRVLGFNTFETLFLTRPGLLCLVGGASLMFLAAQWNMRLVRAACARDPAPGLELELIAIALAGGGSAARARETVSAALAALTEHASAGEVEDVLALSRRAGVPAGQLLRSAAEQCRRTARSEGQRRAATLGVILMIPLGACVLPAFMLVGVVPLLISVLSSTVTTR